MSTLVIILLGFYLAITLLVLTLNLGTVQSLADAEHPALKADRRQALRWALMAPLWPLWVLGMIVLDVAYWAHIGGRR